MASSSVKDSAAAKAEDKAALSNSTSANGAEVSRHMGLRYDSTLLNCRLGMDICPDRVSARWGIECGAECAKGCAVRACNRLMRDVARTVVSVCLGHLAALHFSKQQRQHCG